MCNEVMWVKAEKGAALWHTVCMVQKFPESLLNSHVLESAHAQPRPPHISGSADIQGIVLVLISLYRTITLFLWQSVLCLTNLICDLYSIPNLTPNFFYHFDTIMLLDQTRVFTSDFCSLCCCAVWVKFLYCNWKQSNLTGRGELLLNCYYTYSVMHFNVSLTSEKLPSVSNWMGFRDDKPDKIKIMWVKIWLYNHRDITWVKNEANNTSHFLLLLLLSYWEWWAATSYLVFVSIFCLYFC